VDRVVDLVDEPWHASVMPPGDDPAFRMTVFDSGNGLLSFYSDDLAELIRHFRCHLDRLTSADIARESSDSP